MEWNRFFIARKEINAIPEVKKYLQEANEQLFYAFNRSNFYAVAPEYFFDGCSIGTATMYTEEDIGAERIINRVIDPNEVYISPNRYGEIDVLFRKYKMTARSAFDEFGNKLSDKIQQSAKNAPETEFEFLHGVYPNTDRQLGKIDSNNKAFSSVYLEATGTNDLLNGRNS
jgi:hypothetical protein